jgi:WD40 repeat protein
MSKHYSFLGTVVVAALGLSAVLTAAPTPAPEEKDPRSPSEIQAAQDDLHALLHAAARPDGNQDEVWQAWRAFQHKHAGTPEWRRAAEAMGRVRSPLDDLDREKLPAGERPPWLPQEVLASLGDLRWRAPGGAGVIGVSADGRIASIGSYGIRYWDLDPLHERFVIPGGAALGSAPDDKLLVASSYNGADVIFHLWDMSGDKPRERAIFGTKQGSLRTAMLAADHRTLLVSQWDRNDALESEDEAIHRWDISVDPPKELPPLTKSTRSFQNLALARKSMTLAMVDDASPGATVDIWDFGTEPPRIRCKVPFRSEFGPGPFALSPDGKRLAIRHIKRQAVVLWDVSGAEPKGVDTLEGVEFRNLMFSADGGIVAVMEHDPILHLWPVTDAARKDFALKEGESLANFALDYVPVSMAFAEDGKTLVMAGDDSAIHVWDLQKHADRFPAPRGHRGEVRAIAFAPDGKTLATAADDQTIRLWDLTGRRPEETAKVEAAGKAISSLAFASDGRTLVSLGAAYAENGAASDDNAVRLWDVTDRKAPHALAAWRVPAGSAYSVAPHPTEPWLLVGGMLRGDKLHEDPKTHEQRSDARGYAGLWDLAGRPPAERAAFHCDDPEPDVNDNEYQVRGPVVNSPTFDARGRLLICRTGAGTVRVLACSADSLKELSKFKPYFHGLGALALSPDGRTLATNGWNSQDDHGLRLWDWDSKEVKPRSDFRAEQPSDLSGLTFSPDGKRLAGITDNGFAVYDVPSGKIVYQCGVVGRPNQIAFAPDGRHLATANANSTVYIFRLPAVP